MKRREFLQTAGAGLAASTTVAAPAIAQSMPELKWRCTTSWPKSLDVPFSASETISKYVAEASDNKFQIQPFAAGEIVPALQVLDAVTNATVEMCHTAAYYFIGKDPTYALYCLRPVRPELASAERLVSGSRRSGHAQRVRQEEQIIRHLRRQYRHPDGRLVPQGDQHRR